MTEGVGASWGARSSPFPLTRSVCSSLVNAACLSRKCCVTSDLTIWAWPSGSSSLSKAFKAKFRASVFSYFKKVRSSFARKMLLENSVYRAVEVDTRRYLGR